TTCNSEALAQHLTPDLPRTIDREVLCKDTLDLRFELQVPLHPRRQFRGISALGDMIVVGRWGDRQHLADRLDPMRLAVIVNERDHRLNRRPSSAWARWMLSSVPDDGGAPLNWKSPSILALPPPTPTERPLAALLSNFILVTRHRQSKPDCAKWR